MSERVLITVALAIVLFTSTPMGSLEIGGGPDVASTFDFKVWMRDQDSGTSQASATYTEVQLVTGMQFHKEINRMGTLSARFYTSSGPPDSSFELDRNIRVTRTDSTTGKDGTIVSDFILREWDFDEHSGIAYDIKAYDLSVLVADKVLPFSNSPRTGDGSSATARAIVQSFLSEKSISEGTIDTTTYAQSGTTLGAGKSIQYRAENDSLLDAIADIAKDVDVYWFVDGASSVNDQTAANHDPTDPRVHFVNPDNAAFDLSSPGAGRTLDRTEVRRPFDSQDGNQGNIGTVFVIGGGSGTASGGSANRITAQYPVVATGREMIYRDPAIQDQSTADTVARTIFERENDSDRPQKERGSCVRLLPRLYDSDFSATLGDAIKVEDSSGDLINGVFWSYQYQQGGEALTIMFNRGSDHFLEEVRGIARAAQKYTDYAQVTDSDGSVKATGGDLQPASADVVINNISLSAGGSTTITKTGVNIPGDAPGYFVSLTLDPNGVYDGPVQVSIDLYSGGVFQAIILLESFGPFVNDGVTYSYQRTYPFSANLSNDIDEIRVLVLNQNDFDTFGTSTSTSSNLVSVYSVEYNVDISHTHNTR